MCSDSCSWVMWKKYFSGGFSVVALLAGLMWGSGWAEASSQTNLGKERIFNSPVVR